MKKLILHIGRHKTGTTALQRFLYNNPKLLASHNYFYPMCGLRGYGHHSLGTPMTGASLRTAGEASRKESENYRKLLSEEITKKSLVPVISSESFQNCRPKFVKDFFANYDVSVVIYLREPVAYLISAYAQKVHASDYTGCIEEYCARVYQNTYKQFLDEWEAEFASSLIVKVYDKEELVNRNVVFDFCESILNIDHASTKKNYRDGISNPSLTRVLLDYKLWLNQFYPLPEDHSKMVHDGLAELTLSEPGGEINVSNELIAKIESQFKDSNSEIAKKYFSRSTLFKPYAKVDEFQSARNFEDERIKTTKKLIELYPELSASLLSAHQNIEQQSTKPDWNIFGFNNIIDGTQALQFAQLAGANRKYPRSEDPRVDGDHILPSILPRFQVNKGGRVFTIGSCFAREIEDKLEEFEIPTKQIIFDSSIVTGRGNSILNEFNPGCISQRITWAVDGIDTTSITDTFSGTQELAQDLLLRKGEKLPISDLLKIREKIDNVYSFLPSSDILIITLGMTEAWRDTELGVFLNRMPEVSAIRKHPKRYRLVNFDAKDAFNCMYPAIEKVISSGVDKILVTVSPVPLQTTFSGRDCVVANMYSKASLRCCAEMLCNAFESNVDYFPSYEIAISGGKSTFKDDNIHVKREVVEKITQWMKDSYVTSNDSISKQTATG